MDRRKQRTQAKLESIKRAALELFTAYGADKVRVDEIAAKAHVSKVTIYNHFGSKDELYAEVVAIYIEETLADIERVFDSDIDFLEKLKYALLVKVNTSPLVSWDYLLHVWEKDGQVAENVQRSLQDRVKALMYKLFEEGKRKGYIDEKLPFDLLYLHSEIFRAGIRAKAVDLEAVLVDQEAVEQLVNLLFFGLINRM